MRWRLFHQFIIRRLLGERVRTATTVVGIALGIAVVIGIQLTNASSIRGFETALDTVAGRTSIEIVSNGGIDESRLRALGWLRQFGTVSPVIQGDMAIVSGPPATGRPGASDRAPTGALAQVRRTRSEAVRVLGVDILRDQPFRDYQLLRVEGGAADGAAVSDAALPGHPHQRTGGGHPGEAGAPQRLVAGR